MGPAGEAADKDVFITQLSFKLNQHFVDHPLYNRFGQCLELNNRIKSITKLRSKQALDGSATFSLVILLGEAYGRTTHLLSTCVCRHHNDDVSKVGFAPIVVGKRTVVHYLQKQIENLEQYGLIKDRGVKWAWAP